MGGLLIALGMYELYAFLAHKKPLSAYAKHGTGGPLLAGACVAFLVHLLMEGQRK